MSINEAMVSGRIQKITYGLVDTGKIYSLAIIKLEIEKCNEAIKVIVKNDLADNIYRKNAVGDIVLVHGHLRKAKKELYIFATQITLFKDVLKLSHMKCLNPIFIEKQADLNIKTKCGNKNIYASGKECNKNGKDFKKKI